MLQEALISLDCIELLVIEKLLFLRTGVLTSLDKLITYLNVIVAPKKKPFAEDLGLSS